MYRRAVLLACLLACPARADAPVASYLFPAGGQRGTTVKVRAGGLFLHEGCAWELTGPGLRPGPALTRTRTRWFEGPMLPLPDSQRQEDYPQDMLGEVRIDAAAPVGPRRFRVWTAEGAASGPAFVVGDLPEVVEDEADGEAVPTPVRLPVTVNGRIFPRENIDAWSFPARQGEVITCEVHAARIGSPLDSRLEVRGPDGRPVAENDDHHGTDSLVSFTAPTAGVYQVRIQDARREGSQRHVYRLTLTSGPSIRHAFPPGARPGTKVALRLTGDGVPAAPREVVIPPDAPARWSAPVPLDGGASRPVTLDVDDLPEERKAPAGKDGAGQRAVWPAVLNGRIDRPGACDVWRIAGKKGEAAALDLRASRLGSPLDCVVELTGVDGVPVRRLEHDAAAVVTFPADGDYLLRVRDRFRSRGGPAFGYRLRVDRPRPGFTLALAADALTAPRGKPATVPLRVERGDGFNDAVALRFTGLPPGVTVTPDKVPAGAATVALTFTASKEARVGVARVTVTGSARLAGRKVTHTAADDLLLGVALTAPFKLVGSYDLRLVPRGSVVRKRYRVERKGFAGALEASLADRQMRHLQGVVGPRVVIPPGQSTFDYPVTLPPWMEIGRTSRACVMVVGKVRDGGVEHTVSATSQEQNEQIIAVVETGRLGLELGRKSLAAASGQVVALPVEVRRGKGLRGAVEIDLVVPDDARGVSAGRLTLAAGRSKGLLEVRFDGRIDRPRSPLTVRATLATPAGPVTAEAAVEVVAP